MNDKDLQTLREAAKDGATWKDLASIIGISDRTLRRWRDEFEETELYKEGFFDGLEDEDRRPIPDVAPRILAAIHSGRAEGRQDLINTIPPAGRRKKRPAHPHGPPQTHGQHGQIARISPILNKKHPSERTKRTYKYEKIHKNTPLNPPDSASPTTPTQITAHPLSLPKSQFRQPRTSGATNPCSSLSTIHYPLSTIHCSSSQPIP